MSAVASFWSKGNTAHFGQKNQRSIRAPSKPHTVQRKQCVLYSLTYYSNQNSGLCSSTYPRLQSPVAECFPQLQSRLGIVLSDLRLVCSGLTIETYFMKLPTHSSCAEAALSQQRMHFVPTEISTWTEIIHYGADSIFDMHWLCHSDCDI